MLLSIHAIYEFSRGCEIIMSNLQWRHNIVGTIALTRICTIYVHLKETRATDPFI